MKTHDGRRLEELRQAVAVGLDDLKAGRAQPLNRKTLDALKARARARLAATKKGA